MNMISPIAYEQAHFAANGRRREISAEFIEMWVGIAKPGDRLTYYAGPCLVKARFAKPHVEAVAAMVLDLAEAGLVAPLQKKRGDKILYIIEKVSKCFPL